MQKYQWDLTSGYFFVIGVNGRGCVRAAQSGYRRDTRFLSMSREFLPVSIQGICGFRPEREVVTSIGLLKDAL
jgi:hypothetical protein